MGDEQVVSQRTSGRQRRPSKKPQAPPPLTLTPQSCQGICQQLLEATQAEPSALRNALPAPQFKQLLDQAANLLQHEPTLLELNELQPQQRVCMVGDTHGQFHDAVHMVSLVGQPSEELIYVWNGDYVDRGAWGVELLAFLLCWKLAAPRWFKLLRGNHESSTCTRWYGFKTELEAKYGRQDARILYAACKRVFALLPLAALVQNKTLILHGGLFRYVAIPEKGPGGNRKGAGGSKKRKRVAGEEEDAAAGDAVAATGEGAAPGSHASTQPPAEPTAGSGGAGTTTGAPTTRNGGPAESVAEASSTAAPAANGGVEPQLRLGDLSVLRRAGKGGVDPDGEGNTIVASDVLWSDPVMEPGLKPNDARGVGLVFGPDMTQEFLSVNGLSLILRSHEGPDARDKRSDLGQVLNGYALDHDVPAGKLMTVFSAPDYPQFMAAGEERYNNKGAVALLSGPTWTQPQFVTYEAAPRPKATAYYEYEALGDTDDELMAAEIGKEGGEDEMAPSTVATPEVSTLRQTQLTTGSQQQQQADDASTADTSAVTTSQVLAPTQPVEAEAQAAAPVEANGNGHVGSAGTSTPAQADAQLNCTDQMQEEAPSAAAGGAVQGDVMAAQDGAVLCSTIPVAKALGGDNGGLSLIIADSKEAAIPSKEPGSVLSLFEGIC